MFLRCRKIIGDVGGIVSGFCTFEHIVDMLALPTTKRGGSLSCSAVMYCMFIYVPNSGHLEFLLLDLIMFKKISTVYQEFRNYKFDLF